MGKKYASIHIFVEGSNEQEEVLATIKKYYRKYKSQKGTLRKVINIFSNAEVRQMFERINQLSAYEVLMVQTESYVSIYDKDQGFETVEKQARQISKLVSYPIVYVSNFDEDILVYGVSKAGKLVTNGKFGDECYGIEPKLMDINLFCKELNITRTASMEYINTSEDIDEIENELEECLKVPLNLYADLDSENYLVKNKENGVYIYKKL